MVGRGINTVLLNGEVKHITDLDQDSLCAEWAKRQREINELYETNRRANQGWRGLILRLIGVHLPDKQTVFLGGVNSSDDAIYPPANN